MNVVNLNFCAEGYYSGQTYEENILISEELYEKIEDKLVEMTVYIYELDGKHSCVEGEINVQPCEEKNIPGWYNDKLVDDGESFWSDLEELCEDIGLDLVEDVNTVKKYIDSLDFKVNVTVSVRKSNVEKLNEFVKTLEK